MKMTLKFFAATALVALFAAPMHASSAHLHGPGYWGPHYGSGVYHPWHGHGHGRGFGRGHGHLSGGIGFSMGAGGYGRGWGRGYSRPYWAHHRHHARHWRGAPFAMTAPTTTASDNGRY